jgi:wyosine [tRNA(Phe)-imidazoG37] synthetase (radical SAM superfamily)
MRGHTMPARLLFADARGVVYDHPHLLAAARSGDDIVAPADRPLALPDGATLCVLPGRRPVGVDPATGEAVVLREVKVGRRTFAPHAVGATLPPGFTRTLLPAASRPALARADDAPVLPQWAYTAAGLGAAGPVAWAVRTDRRRHWDARSHSTADLPRLVERRVASTDNAVWHQIARCAVEWRCFTAQNTFYGRDEGAVPSSAACNAACVGCLSEVDEGMPPSSHERILRPPSAEAMADLAAEHLATATGRVIVSFGQGCEGEPLLRWRAIADAIRLVRRRTRRGSINVNTNGSLPDALAALVDAGLDACRISLNSASPDLYAAYYRPSGYGFADVVRSMKVARRGGAYLALNLLTFPGVTDREGEVERLCELVREVGVDQVQTRSLAIDPDVYMALARSAGGRGPALGVPALLAALRDARPGLVIGNFARAKGERRRSTPRLRRSAQGERWGAAVGGASTPRKASARAAR